MKNRIKVLIAVFVTAILPVTVAAQENTSGISLKAVVVDDDIPAAAVKNIETKLQRALASNGIGDMDYTQRFVLAAKVDVVQNDVMPSNPPRVSKKLDLTLMVGDVIENKIYETCTMTLAGIGTNEAKAFISAFSRVNPNNEELQSMLAAAKEEIMAYYENNCDYIISNANSLAGQQKYDEAIARLMSVPEVCKDCYEKCQTAAVKIFGQRLDADCSALLNEAKNEWMHSKDAESAAKVAGIISRIDPLWPDYPEVVKFRDEISSKLSADEKREWDMMVKKYEDEQAFKKQQYEDERDFRLQQHNDEIANQRLIIDACREIGVAWGKNQPQTVTRNIARFW